LKNDPSLACVSAHATGAANIFGTGKRLLSLSCRRLQLLITASRLAYFRSYIENKRPVAGSHRQKAEGTGQTVRTHGIFGRPVLRADTTPGKVTLLNKKKDEGDELPFSHELTGRRYDEPKLLVDGGAFLFPGPHYRPNANFMSSVRRNQLSDREHAASDAKDLQHQRPPENRDPRPNQSKERLW
jgi:hypothetical protein